MGHKGDIEAVYTLNKKKLPPEVVEQMRSCYAKAQTYLQTVALKNSAEELARGFKRQLLLVAGMKPDDITDEHLRLAEEEFHRLVREKLLKEVTGDQRTQKVVDIGEVEAHLMQGWEFVGLLPHEKAILKPASGMQAPQSPFLCHDT